MRDVFEALGLTDPNPGAAARGWLPTTGAELVSENPATGKPLARVRMATAAEYDRVAAAAAETFRSWRLVPAPRRGEVVRDLGEELRRLKDPLGRLVSLESGKILSEGLGEVQEMIDICDYAVGLSRQLHGLTLPSERPGHRMMEQWHPLGPVGIITAFNFPTAVWAWNAALAAVCGDSMVWKPSPRTPLCAVAVQRLCERVMERHGCPGVFNLVIGPDAEVGARLLEDRRLPLISATGSCRLGHVVADTVGKRLGRMILELGGNNAVIVLDDADLDLATRAVVFGAVGTAGQRCTTTRRLIVQKGIAAELVRRLRKAYASVKIGDPLEPGTLCGPLIAADAVSGFLKALDAARAQGGEVLCGGRKLDRPGYFVEPTLVRAHAGMAIVRQETFAPILYVLEVATLEEAIALHNGVEQGLSSAIFTRDLLAAEAFLAPAGSDCGIANVNCGTSGAEIGGAFGGEKETGGGREAGSDSWKAYMRRQTNVVNFSRELPLAQGVSFGG